MLAGAEAVRTAESANVMHSLVLHSGRRSSQSFEGTMDVAGSEMIPSSDSLMRHLTALNTSAEDVQDGKGFLASEKLHDDMPADLDKNYLPLMAGEI